MRSTSLLVEPVAAEPYEMRDRFVALPCGDGDDGVRLRFCVDTEPLAAAMTRRQRRNDVSTVSATAQNIDSPSGICTMVYFP